MEGRSLLARGRVRARRAAGSVLSEEALLETLVARVAQADTDDRQLALLVELARRLPRTVLGRFLEVGLPVRRLEYEPHEILLTLTSKDVGLRLRAARKEPFTVEWIEELVRPGDVLYDVGASVGPYSLIAAKTTGGKARIFAFEPAAPSYHDLCRNIALNGCDDCITPLPVALYDRSGFVQFDYRSLTPGTAQHAMGGGDREPSAYRQQVVALRLDDLVGLLGLPVPTHAKIDVDGPELEVLHGARETLADERWRSIMIELPKEPEAESRIVSLLAEHGFSVRGRHRREGAAADLNVSFVRDAG